MGYAGCSRGTSLLRVGSVLPRYTEVLPVSFPFANVPNSSLTPSYQASAKTLTISANHDRTCVLVLSRGFQAGCGNVTQGNKKHVRFRHLSNRSTFPDEIQRAGCDEP